MNNEQKPLDIPKPKYKDIQLIRDLLKNIVFKPESEDVLRLERLQHTFSKFIYNHENVLSSLLLPYEQDSKKTHIKISRWYKFLLRGQSEFLDQLYSRVRQGRKWALRAIMGIIASSPSTLSFSKRRTRCVNEGLLYRLLKSAIYCIPDIDSIGGDYNTVYEPISEITITFIEQDFFIFRDIQYFSLLLIQKLAEEIYFIDLSQKKKRK